MMSLLQQNANSAILALIQLLETLTTHLQVVSLVFLILSILGTVMPLYLSSTSLHEYAKCMPQKIFTET